MSDALVDIFRDLGVDDPEGWARSERDEGIDQTARATILRALADIANAAPQTWAAQRQHGGTEAVRAAAERIARSGASEADIADLSRAVAFNLVFDVLALFGGATEPEANPADVSFTVRRTDSEDFEPVGVELMLHESWREVAAVILGERIVNR